MSAESLLNGGLEICKVRNSVVLTIRIAIKISICLFNTVKMDLRHCDRDNFRPG